MKNEMGYRVANVVSYGINPLILPPISFGIALWYVGAPASELWTSVMATFVFFCVVPLLYIAWMVSDGRARTLEVRTRKRRTLPFAVGVASYLIGIVLLWALLDEARTMVLALAVLFPLNTLIVLLINLKWKISVHVMSIAGFVATFSFVCAQAVPVGSSPTVLNIVLFVGALSVLLLMWARVRVGAHTPAQVIGGSLFGFFVTAFELAILLSWNPELFVV